jgi:2'-5' RNA ligase
VSKLTAITQAMDAAVQNQPTLTLQLSGTGCFPHVKRPRVIWAGLAGQVAELVALKQKLDAGLQPLGWEMEKRPFRQAQDKPFKPHLTLGRVKDDKKLRGVSWAVDMEAVVVGITAVHLIESQLTRQGPIYTARHTSQFASR